MELKAITQRNYLYLEANMTVQQAISLLNVTDASHAIIFRQWRTPLYYLYDTDELRYRLSPAARAAPLIEALNLHETDAAPAIDSAAPAEQAPDTCVVLDGDELVGFYDVGQEPPESYRGAEPERSFRGEGAEATPAEGALERYLAAEFPDAVQLGETAQLEIYLTSFASGGQGKIISQPAGTSIKIGVQARSGFEPVGDIEGTLVVTAEEQGPRLRFKFKAVEAGAGQLIVLAYLHGLEVSRVKVICEVRPATAAGQTGETVLHQGDIQTSLAAYPDLVVHIEQAGPLDSLEYTFTITAADPNLNLNLAKYGPHRMGPYPRQYFDDFYQKIENLEIRTPAQRQHADQALKAKGLELFTTMLPPEMQQLMWSLRQRIRTVFIQSSEPWVPWELCRLSSRKNGDTQEGDFFCEAFELTRWVPGIPLRQNLHMNKLAVVVPYGSGLASAPLELEYLQGLARGGRTVSQIPARFSDLHAAFKRGEYDVWHFTGHGEADQTLPNLSEIKLEDFAYSAQNLNGEAANLGRTGPLVFLNACQIGRSGVSFAGQGGWAHQFLRAGAGAFIGALWSVYDTPAYYFAEELYTRLLTGETIGKAVQGARLAIKKEGDPTWLAYTVFAYPSAKVV